MMLIGTLVPSFDVARTRITSASSNFIGLVGASFDVHLGDLAVGRNQVVGELATISIRHRNHNDAVVLTVLERDLGDFGEIAPRNQSIARRIGAKLVEINALKKMLLLGGPFWAGI